MQLQYINFESMSIIRKTKSVKILIKTINDSNCAISVVDLIKKYKNQMNKSTIYRILEKLENQRMVHSFISPDGLKMYAKCNSISSQIPVDTHPHFQCNECGQIDCLPSNVSIPVIPNRKVDFAKILIVGKCEQCI